MTVTFEDALALWTREEALALCRLVEAIAPSCGCHVALTGGLLYKDGPRKDCDLVIYRIRQEDRIDGPKLMQALVDVGFELKVGDASCWLMKAEYRGKPVDFFFPENEGGDYDHGGPELEAVDSDAPIPAFFASFDGGDDVDF